MLSMNLFFQNGIIIENIVMKNDILFISIISSQIDSICPCCSKKSSRVHSRYRRTLSDLPILDKKVILNLCTRKFFCDNEKCDRVIFTERYNKLIKVYARKTDRLNKLLERIAFATSAEIASKIANTSITNISSDTILRIIKRAEITPVTDYECIGIDDWAFRKGNKYGTLICDLKTHKPIAVLKDRNYDTVAGWFKDKPEIKYCSRDRSSTYKAALKDTLPKVEHVADRFHLVHNIGQVVIDYLKRKHTNGIVLKSYDVKENKKEISEYTKKLKDEQKQRYEKKWDLIREVQEMYKIIPNISHVSRYFSLNWDTVTNYLKIQEPPKPQTRYRTSILDEYKQKVIELLIQGKKNTQILEIIKKDGFTGSEKTLRNFTKKYRDGKYNAYKSKENGYVTQRITRKKIMSPLFKYPQELNEKQKTQLEKIKEEVSINELYSYVQGFRLIIKDRKLIELNEWIKKAISSEINELKVFAQGLENDIDSIKNALIFDYSNGILEGNVNRLKMIKRIMYGRAGYDLISKRVLYTY